MPSCGVENGSVVLIAATTENRRSRSSRRCRRALLLLTLKPALRRRPAGAHRPSGRGSAGTRGDMALGDDARDAPARPSSGDARRALTALEAAASLAPPVEGDDAPKLITAEHVAQAVDRALPRYDRQGDEHDDVISAFIKSIRGFDVDAATHYLARMIEAGEDPRFIARRLIISGGGGHRTCRPCRAAARRGVRCRCRAVHRDAGGPDPVAEATAYLAARRRSPTRAYVAIDKAIVDVRAGGFGRVPAPLRDAHVRRRGATGRRQGLPCTPTTARSGSWPSSMPTSCAATRDDEPTSDGQERDVQARLEKDSGASSTGDDERDASADAPCHPALRGSERKRSRTARRGRGHRRWRAPCASAAAARGRRRRRR